MKLRKTILLAVLAGCLAGRTAIAHEMPVSVLQDTKNLDAQMLFEQDDKPAEMLGLSGAEMQQTQGEFFWTLIYPVGIGIALAAGVGVWAAKMHKNNKR